MREKLELKIDRIQEQKEEDFVLQVKKVCGDTTLASFIDKAKPKEELDFGW